MLYQFINPFVSLFVDISPTSFVISSISFFLGIMRSFSFVSIRTCLVLFEVTLVLMSLNFVSKQLASGILFSI